MKFAGGHDRGRLALPAPDEINAGAEREDGDQRAGRGPWEETRDPSGSGSFLAARPPIELGSSPAADSERGPWGPHRK